MKESPILSAFCLICGRPEAIIRRGVYARLEYLPPVQTETLHIEIVVFIVVVVLIGMLTFEISF